jgi:NDP-sugar pyrophosphorylase family protein
MRLTLSIHNGEYQLSEDRNPVGKKIEAFSGKSVDEIAKDLIEAGITDLVPRIFQNFPQKEQYDAFKRLADSFEKVVPITFHTFWREARRNASLHFIFD